MLIFGGESLKAGGLPSPLEYRLFWMTVTSVLRSDRVVSTWMGSTQIVVIYNWKKPSNRGVTITHG